MNKQDTTERTTKVGIIRNPCQSEEHPGPSHVEALGLIIQCRLIGDGVWCHIHVLVWM
jgi:hypothetical protein